MNLERFHELLNKEIDGLNSPAESQELSAYVQSNAEARELHQDLLKLSNALSRVQEVDPPQSLKSDILSAIRLSQKSPASKPSLVQWVKDLIESRTTFQYAYVFSAGLLIGIAIYSMLSVNSVTRNATDPASVSGSIILNSTAYPFAAGHGVQFDIEGQAISGSVTTKYSSDLAVIEIDVQSNELVDVAVNFNPEILRFKGYSQSEPTSGTRSLLENSFRISTQGKNHYILAFERITQSSAEVAIAVERQTASLYRQSLLLAEQTR